MNGYRSWKAVPATAVLELEVEFESTGHYSPARLSGPPEDCHEEDRVDERTVTGVFLCGKRLPDDLAAQLAVLAGPAWDEAVHEVRLPAGQTDQELRQLARAEWAEAVREGRHV